MFIQVLQGQVSDVDELRARFDDWLRDLAPSATGWLGTTAGATSDGEFIAVVRFDDEASARANSGRSEQGDWWSGTSELFDGDVVFHDYPHTEMFLGGGSDDAGFVQIIQGTYSGTGSPADMTEEESEEMTTMRPDVIGGTYAWDDTGHFTQTIYFTSEEAAREGERAMDQNAAASERMQEWMAQVENLRFLDLTDPSMASP